MTIDLSSSSVPEVADAREAMYAVREHIPDGTPVLVVGAVARNLLLTALDARQTLAYTADVDVAVRVPSHQAYRQVTAGLPGRQSNGYTFTVGDHQIDVVAFGEIEDDERRVPWNEDQWNVLGFEESLAAALPVRLSPDLSCRVAPLTALCALKVLAFDDRHPATVKDAPDLALLLKAHEDGGLLESDDRGLFERALEATDYSWSLASAYYLGAGLAQTMGVPTWTAVVAVLQREDRRFTLLGLMGTAVAANEERLEQYLRGALEHPPEDPPARDD